MVLIWGPARTDVEEDAVLSVGWGMGQKRGQGEVEGESGSTPLPGTERVLDLLRLGVDVSDSVENCLHKGEKKRGCLFGAGMGGGGKINAMGCTNINRLKTELLLSQKTTLKRGGRELLKMYGHMSAKNPARRRGFFKV